MVWFGLGVRNFVPHHAHRQFDQIKISRGFPFAFSSRIIRRLIPGIPRFGSA
jgi:hypothetical protein